jgi:hypothetical protein
MTSNGGKYQDRIDADTVAEADANIVLELLRAIRATLAIHDEKLEEVIGRIDAMQVRLDRSRLSRIERIEHR